jgi:hypothetical protein
MNVFAYAEAEGHLRRALEVQEVLDSDDKLGRCDLLLALSRAILPQAGQDRLLPACDEAYSVAVAANEASRAEQGALLALQALAGLGRGPGLIDTLRSIETATWLDRADRVVASDSLSRVYVDLFRGLQQIFVTSPKAGHVHLRSGVELALRLEEPAAVFAAASYGFAYLNALRDRGLKERLALEASSHSHDGIRALDLSLYLEELATFRLDQGDRRAAEAAWQELDSLAKQTGDTSIILRSRAHDSLAAFLDGHLVEAWELQEALRQEAIVIGIAPRGRLVRAIQLTGGLTTALLPDQRARGPRAERAA